MSTTVTIDRIKLRDAIRSERIAADKLRRANCDINEDYAAYREAHKHYEVCMAIVDSLIYTANEAP